MTKVTEEQRRARVDRLREQLDEETATLLLEVTGASPSSAGT